MKIRYPLPPHHREGGEEGRNLITFLSRGAVEAEKREEE